MSQLKIRQALERALFGNGGMIAEAQTRIENRPFSPTPDVAYQRVDLIPAEPENPTFGDGFHREVGTFQILLMYPADVGAGAAQAQAELVRDLFHRGATFERDGLTVVVSRTPSIGPGYQDGNRYALPVRIRYYANV